MRSNNRQKMPPLFRLYDTTTRHEIENTVLAPCAYRSRKAEKERQIPEASHPYRTAFQRDRDRIVHSRAFRRLKQKRQVFLTTTGDHYRTRLTHTMEVSQISRTIARALGLNEDLTEAIALGHDLGHTPFGHLGETVLDGLLQGKFGDRNGFPRQNCGGFKHNYQSLRVVDFLEQRYESRGLNLTAPVREGIIKHTGLRRNRIAYPDFDLSALHFDLDNATTLEGQVVALADEIAQRTHDLEDGLRANLVSDEEVRKLDIVVQAEERLNITRLFFENHYLYRNRLINGIIDLLVSDLITSTLKNVETYYQNKKRLEVFDEMIVGFGSVVDKLQKQLNKFIYQKIIFVPAIENADQQAIDVLLQIFAAYKNDPVHMPQNVQKQLAECDRCDEAMTARIICDHIAGMTDAFALAEIRHLIQVGVIEKDFEIDRLTLESLH